MLILLAVLTFSFSPAKDGKVIIIVSMEVKNYTEWKKGFDAGAPIREKAGIKVISVGSTLDNENKIILIEEAESAKAAEDFLTLLKSKLNKDEVSNVEVKMYDLAE